MEKKYKPTTRVTIDNTILEILDEYLEENEISNRSKYIEKLIREDFERKGKKIERKF